MDLSFPEALDSAAVDAVRALAATVEAEDGAPPLSDQALTRLGSAEVRHAVLREGGTVVGYAQLSGRSLEVAGPAQLVDAFGPDAELVWSHGRRSRLAGPLAQHGFADVRKLYQLRRELDGSIEVPPDPPGIEIRPFVVGRDEAAQVRVNNAAFATHAEQGTWTTRDVEARESESWFDPAGFLLAWRGNDLVGFHWTKVHSPTLGEVYILGVDPSGQGIGLGSVLLQRGLAYLHERGCTEVLLYVDDSNPTALRLYERNGFHEHDLDVQWSRVG